MSSHLKRSAADATKPRRGRPPVLTEDTRRQRILAAAERVFTNSGYGAASMEEIARTAGMSKKTLYGMFPDQRALFAELTNVFDVYPTEALRRDAASSRKELRARLLEIAELALSRRQIEMTRLVISEARHCPELADEFRSKAMTKVKAYLVSALQTYADANPQVAITDIEGTAITLFSAVLGDMHIRALLGEPIASRRKLAAHIDRAIALVLPNLVR